MVNAMEKFEEFQFKPNLLQLKLDVDFIQIKKEDFDNDAHQTSFSIQNSENIPDYHRILKEELCTEGGAMHQSELETELDDIPKKEVDEDINLTTVNRGALFLSTKIKQEPVCYNSEVFKSSSSFHTKSVSNSFSTRGSNLEEEVNVQSHEGLSEGKESDKRSKHSGEKPFKCDLCPAEFKRGSKLKIHQNKHNGEKPYQCDLCPTAFTAPSSLKYHKMSHAGKKPFQCNICPSEFMLRSCLDRHKRIHTGEKPYKCDLCQSKFAHESSLSKHKMLHTGEKPYKCDLCRSQFAHRSYLTKHNGIHTGDKPYKCDLCRSQFARRSALTKHKRLHTGEKPPQM